MYPPSTPSSRRFFKRIFAKVPRIIISWLPRLEPYELKSARSIPCSARYLPAGESALMFPAGEIWSVVTESPKIASTRAPEISTTGVGCLGIPSKYGGLRTYVDLASHSKILPVGVASDFQR